MVDGRNNLHHRWVSRALAELLASSESQLGERVEATRFSPGQFVLVTCRDQMGAWACARALETRHQQAGLRAHILAWEHDRLGSFAPFEALGVQNPPEGEEAFEGLLAELADPSCDALRLDTLLFEHWGEVSPRRLEKRYLSRHHQALEILHKGLHPQKGKGPVGWILHVPPLNNPIVSSLLLSLMRLCWKAPADANFWIVLEESRVGTRREVSLFKGLVSLSAPQHQEFTLQNPFPTELRAFLEKWSPSRAEESHKDIQLRLRRDFQVGLVDRDPFVSSLWEEILKEFPPEGEQKEDSHFGCEMGVGAQRIHEVGSESYKKAFRDGDMPALAHLLGKKTDHTPFERFALLTSFFHMRFSSASPYVKEGQLQAWCDELEKELPRMGLFSRALFLRWQWHFQKTKSPLEERLWEPLEGKDRQRIFLICVLSWMESLLGVMSEAQKNLVKDVRILFRLEGDASTALEGAFGEVWGRTELQLKTLEICHSENPAEHPEYPAFAQEVKWRVKNAWGVIREDPRIIQFLSIHAVDSQVVSEAACGTTPIEAMEAELSGLVSVVPLTELPIPLRNLGEKYACARQFSRAMEPIRQGEWISQYCAESRVKGVLNSDLVMFQFAGGLYMPDWHKRMEYAIDEVASMRKPYWEVYYYHYFCKAAIVVGDFEVFAKRVMLLREFIENHGLQKSNLDTLCLQYEFLKDLEASVPSESLGCVLDRHKKAQEESLKLLDTPILGSWHFGAHLLHFLVAVREGRRSDMERFLDTLLAAPEYSGMECFPRVLLLESLMAFLAPDDPLSTAIAQRGLHLLFETWRAGWNSPEERLNYMSSPVMHRLLHRPLQTPGRRLEWVNLLTDAMAAAQNHHEVVQVLLLIGLSLMGVDSIHIQVGEGLDTPIHWGLRRVGSPDHGLIFQGRHKGALFEVMQEPLSARPTGKALEKIEEWVTQPGSPPWTAKRIGNRAWSLSKEGLQLEVRMHFRTPEAEDITLGQLRKRPEFLFVLRQTETSLRHLSRVVQLEARIRKVEVHAASHISEASTESDTAYLEAERLRELNEELKKMDRVKSEFFATVSHEFRTPLTLSIGLLDSLKEAAMLEGNSLALLKRATVAQRQLLALVNDFLDHAKLEASRFEPKPEHGDVENWIHTLAACFAPEAERLGIQFEFQAEKGTVILCDHFHFERIFFNLLSNAFKFTRKGGRVRLDAMGGPSHVNIAVSDTGVGMDSDELSKIFEKFKSRSSENLAQLGTGIGLSLVKDLLKINGGDIEVTSSPGQGSRFVVTLPLGDKTKIDKIDGQISSSHLSALNTTLSGEAEEEELESLPHRDGLARVLVVEDNRDIRLLLRTILSSQYNCDFANDGLHGWNLVQKKQYDLILSDFMMPHLNGLELLMRVRNESPTALIPFVILTAKEDDSARRACLQAGVSEFLSKPFSPVELQLRIKNLLDISELQTRLRHQATLEGLGRLAVAIAHEINNPLQLLTLLEEEIEGDGLLPPESLRELKEISSRITQAVRTLQHLRAHVDTQDSSGLSLTEVTQEWIRPSALPRPKAS